MTLIDSVGKNYDENPTLYEYYCIVTTTLTAFLLTTFLLLFALPKFSSKPNQKFGAKNNRVSGEKIAPNFT